MVPLLIAAGAGGKAYKEDPESSLDQKPPEQFENSTTTPSTNGQSGAAGKMMAAIEKQSIHIFSFSICIHSNQVLKCQLELLQLSCFPSFLFVESMEIKSAFHFGCFLCTVSSKFVVLLTFPIIRIANIYTLFSVNYSYYIFNDFNCVYFGWRSEKFQGQQFPLLIKCQNGSKWT